MLTKHHPFYALILLVLAGCLKAPEPVPELSRPAAEAFLGRDYRPGWSLQ
jgi:hypothetical protein